MSNYRDDDLNKAASAIDAYQPSGCERQDADEVDRLLRLMAGDDTAGSG